MRVQVKHFEIRVMWQETKIGDKHAAPKGQLAQVPAKNDIRTIETCNLAQWADT